MVLLEYTDGELLTGRFEPLRKHPTDFWKDRPNSFSIGVDVSY